MERRVLTTTFIISIIIREAVSIRCYTDLKKTKVPNTIHYCARYVTIEPKTLAKLRNLEKLWSRKILRLAWLQIKDKASKKKKRL